MLVNIWASIVHLGDKYFCETASVNKGLDFLICKEMSGIVSRKQTWMINPFWKTLGSTGDLLRESYGVLKGSSESYLVLYTPGFADVVLNVPLENVREQLDMLCERVRVFRKRMIGLKLGFPPNAPSEVIERIERINEITETAIKEYGGQMVDVSDITYDTWDDVKGSRPNTYEELAKRIAQAILLSHPEPEAWKNL